MEIQGGKTIKNFILDPTSDLGELFDYMEVDFQITIEGIFSALFVLFKVYDQNKKRVDYLISFLEQVLELKTPEELQVLVGAIIDFNNKFSKLSVNQKEKVNKPYQRIQKIFNTVNNHRRAFVSSSKISYLSYLIFEDKNLSMIETYLADNENLLSSRNQDGNNIFALLLERYLFLNEKDEEEINYFYHVILLFINSKYGDLILKERNTYLKIMKHSDFSYKEHIIKVIELLDPSFKISFSEIEKRYHKRFEFPKVILEEIQTFRKDKSERHDFLYQDCLTIDSSRATCLDDAQYIEQNQDGSYTLYIHITDIPSLVPYDSITDKEARLRAETLYLRDRNLLLYPSCISDCLCSLVPGSIRNTITYIFQLDPSFHLIEDSYQIVKGKIRVRYKLSYDEADKIIQDKSFRKPANLLKNLYLFSLARRRSNREKEKYRIYQNFIEHEQHHESLRIDHSPSANIVHESMILVNYTAALYFKSHSLPYIYRKLEIPSQDFISEQLKKLAELDTKMVRNTSFVNKLKENYVKGIYTKEPVYHKGLNLECYSHSSSPARRYPDSFGQYLMYDMIFNGNLTDFNLCKWEYQIDNLVTYLNFQKNNNERFESHYNYLSRRKLIKKGI